MSTPQESRDKYLSSVFSLDEVIYLNKIGLAQKYIQGEIDIEEVYKELRDQAV
jgi:hypothetical protein